MKKRIVFVILTFLLCFAALEGQRESVSAAPKGHIAVKGSKKKLLSKSTLTAYVGGKNLKFSYSVNGKKKGIKGTWASSDSSVMKISKNGSGKAVGNGTTKISYTFAMGKKKYRLSCKIKVKTRAEEVELKDNLEGLDFISMDQNTEHTFKVNLIPNEKAVEINSDIESTDVVTYALFGDEDCTKPTELGEVSKEGRVRAYGNGGIMYLRAEARASATSKSVVYSNVATITVKGLTKEEKIQEEEKLKKEAEEKAKRDKLRPARIEIVTQAPLDANTPNPIPKNSLFTANASFKIFDGNGTDITFATSTAISAMTAKFKWNGQEYNPVISNNGKVQINLVNTDKIQIINNQQVTTPIQVIYSMGELTLTYKQAGYPDVSTTTTITIVPQAIIRQVEFKGIYKRDLQKQTFVPVLEGNTVALKKDDVIQTSGGNIFFNEMPGAYYLLLKATDIYNNNVAGTGIKAEDIGLVLTGGSDIGLDNVTGDSGGIAIQQSTKPIAIDGIPYLTFALKPGKVKEGELIISARGMQTIKKVISDGSTMLYFFLTGNVKNEFGRAIVGKENILEYQLVTSNGKIEMNYDKVLSFLKLVNIGNAGEIQILPNSDVISGNKNGIFKIRKDKDGNAEIVYHPQMSALIYNPLNTLMPFAPGTEEITILRGWGTNFERKIHVSVSKE